MTKLLLHIGTEKTGTTTVQQFLTRNRTALLQRYGVLYPHAPALFWNNGHFPIAASLLPPKLCDFLPPARRIDADEVFGVLKQSIDSARPRLAVLSCEHFSSRFKSDSIERLADALAGYEVQVLIYLRRQDEMALSSFSTSLSRGRRSWFESGQIHQNNSYWNFARMLDSWARAFSEEAIIVRAYQRNALVDGDIVADFLAATGIERDPDFVNPPRANPSLSAKAAHFLHALNQLLLDWDRAVKNGDSRGYERAQHLRQVLLKIARQQGCFTESPPLRAILSDEEQAALVARFKQTNDMVARRFLGQDALFDDSAGSAEIQPMSSELATADWTRVVLSCAEHIVELEKVPARREARISELKEAARVSEARINELHEAAREGEARISELKGAAAQREARISELEGVVVGREARIGALEETVAQREARVGELEQASSARRKRIQALNDTVARQQARVRDLQSRLASAQALQDRTLTLKNRVLHRLNGIQTSASGQLTSSLYALESRRSTLMRGIALLPKLVWWTLTLRLSQRLRTRRLANELLESGLFDRVWYVEQNPDIVLKGYNPILHWLASGWTEGRNPNPLFHTDWYLEQNPEVAAAGVNPLAHYLESGAAQGRDPCPLFDSGWYVERYPEVAELGLNPLVHYFSNTRNGRLLSFVPGTRGETSPISKNAPSTVESKAGHGSEVQ